jgi:hypothetical protein
MYLLINQHIEQLLAAINEEREVRRYLWLVRNLSDINVAANSEYQREYRKYWQLNAARLSPAFYREYFALLEQSKRADAPDVETVARSLLKISSHRKGRRTLQFSFASKLSHMLDHNLPVYDSMVAAFYFLPTSTGANNTEEKLQQLLASYRFLIKEYVRVLDKGLLAPAIARFRQKYALGYEYSDVKVIDTLVWKFVEFLRSGQVREGTVIYG